MSGTVNDGGFKVTLLDGGRVESRPNRPTGLQGSAAATTG